MNRIAVLALTLQLTGCTSEDDRQTSMMSTIEKAVQLPEGAYPITRYARTYAYGPSNTVLAVYFLPGHPDAFFCKKALKAEDQGAQVWLFCPPPKGMVANERRWLKNYRWLSNASDGECNWIDVTYSLTAKRTESVKCHGVG